MKTNQRISIVLMCLTTCAVLLGCNPFAPGNQSPLLEYLGYIPDQPEYREYMAYGDLQAWYESWGVLRPENFDQVLESEHKSELWTVLPRQTVPPEQLALYFMIEDERDFYGFNLYSINRNFQAGMGGSVITLIDLFDSEQVAPALTEYGYNSSTLRGGTLFSFGEDYAMHMDAPNAAGRLPYFNRIHIDADRLITASATEVVDSALDAHAGKISSLADNKVYQSAAAALEDAALTSLGQMVGVLLLDLDKMEKDPVFDLAAFATFQADETAYLALLLVLPTGQDADATAESVGEKLMDYKSMRGIQLEERWSFYRSYGTTKEGLPVAVIVMTAPVTRGYQEQLDQNYTVVMDWFSLVSSWDLNFLRAAP